MKRSLHNFSHDGLDKKRKLINDEDEMNCNVEISISDDVLRFLIFEFIPVYQWINLELVSKQFYRVTISAYRLLRKLNIYDFYPKTRVANSYNFVMPSSNKKPVNDSAKLDFLLHKFRDVCPKLVEFRSFDCLVNKIAKKHFDILKDFKNLTGLYIENCRIDIIHFADFIPNFENLTDLSLSGCTFIVSKSKGSNGKDLNQNIINAELRLDSVKSIKGLNSLNLSGITTLSGKFLSSFNVDNLLALNLRGSRFFFGYILYDFLENCFQLESLDLSPVHKAADEFDFINSRIIYCPSLFKCLPTLTNLRILKLIGYTNRDPQNEVQLADALSGCKNLTELCLVDNVLVTNCVAQAVFQSCLGLQLLRLDVTQLNSRTLCKFVRLQKLKTLGFYCSKDLSWQVDDAVVSNLIQLKFLESIYLQRPAVSPAKLETFSNLKSLQKIRVSGRIVNNVVVRHWCSNLGQQLLTLDIPYCESLSDGIAIIIANSCKNLQRLNLSYSKITDVGVRKLASECTKLREVDFTQNRIGQITHNSILVLLRSCSDLNSLKLKRSVIQNLLKDVDFKKFQLFIQLISGFAD